VSHANAALTPRQRLRIALLIIDEGWTIAAAADYFRVSWPTAAKWARRYVELGEAGMADRSSRPHTHPNKTPQHLVKKIVHLRMETSRPGPDRRTRRSARFHGPRGPDSLSTEPALPCRCDAVAHRGTDAAAARGSGHGGLAHAA